MPVTNVTIRHAQVMRDVVQSRIGTGCEWLKDLKIIQEIIAGPTVQLANLIFFLILNSGGMKAGIQLASEILSFCN